MFTGIIEEIGQVTSLQTTSNGKRFTVTCQRVLEGTQLGDSIAVNGVCITVVALTPTSFQGDVMEVTLRKSNLKNLQVGTKVHLERALNLQTRLGGHMVSGHIDTVIQVSRIQERQGQFFMTLLIPPGYRKYMIPQGSICLDGVSLTIADLTESHVTVSLIPESKKRTNFTHLRVGDFINLECDLIGKYVENMVKGQEDNSLVDYIKYEF